MFERFADSGVIGKLATPSESFQGMHPVESLNYVNEIAVNQGVSTLKCALALGLPPVASASISELCSGLRHRCIAIRRPSHVNVASCTTGPMRITTRDEANHKDLCLGKVLALDSLLS
jgi:hypothetical protein